MVVSEYKSRLAAGYRQIKKIRCEEQLSQPFFFGKEKKKKLAGQNFIE